MRAFVIGLGLIAASLFVGCVVSSFEKVDDLGDSGVGGQTNGGSGGIGGGPGGDGGQAGQLGTCGNACQPGPFGESACCFVQPTEALPDQCGWVIPPPEANNACWGAGQLYENDASCPTTFHGVGCCLDNGLCGYSDTAHELGCVPTEVFGDAPKPCGANPCGEYCIAANDDNCGIIDSSAPFRFWDCAERCKEGPCIPEIVDVLANCSPFGSCVGNGDPVYGGPAPGCSTSILPLAKCFDTKDSTPPDCVIYCAMVLSACNGGSSLQFPDVDDCLNFCGPLFGGAPALKIGSFNDGSSTGNTLACRLTALGDPAITAGGTPEQACAGAGPAGDFGAGGFKCGSGMCESYCGAFAAGCPGEFGTDFPGGSSECFTTCDTTYPSASAPTFVWEANPTSNNLPCRLHEALEAIAAPTAAKPTLCTTARLQSGGCS